MSVQIAKTIQGVQDHRVFASDLDERQSQIPVEMIELLSSDDEDKHPGDMFASSAGDCEYSPSIFDGQPDAVVFGDGGELSQDKQADEELEGSETKRLQLDDADAPPTSVTEPTDLFAAVDSAPSEPAGDAAGLASEPVPQTTMDAEPAAIQPATRTRASGMHHTKVFSSPDEILIPISPFPACSLRLNANDHRWVSTWKRNIHVDAWIDELGNKSFSQTFDQNDPSDWQSKLKEVHHMAWFKWSLGYPENQDLALDGSRTTPQEPGIIADDVFNQLAPIVRDLPPKKQYSRKTQT